MGVQKGEETEAIVLSKLVQNGINVLTPFGDNTRYDFVVERNNQFVRLQCKTGWTNGSGCVVFNTRSTNVNSTGYKESNYIGDADQFIIFCQDVDGLYSVPVDKASGGKMSLRIEPTENGQTKGINWAEDYKFSPDTLFEGP